MNCDIWLILFFILVLVLAAIAWTLAGQTAGQAWLRGCNWGWWMFSILGFYVLLFVILPAVSGLHTAVTSNSCFDRSLWWLALLALLAIVFAVAAGWWIQDWPLVH